MLKVIQQIQNEIVPKYSNHLSFHALITSLDFIIKSVLQHLHLYHLLLTQPQVTDLTTVDLHMDTPAGDLPSLQDGVEETIWLKAKMREEIESEYDSKAKQLEEVWKQATSQAEADLQSVYDLQLASLSEEPRKMSVKQVSSIISALVKAHMEVSAVTIHQSLLKQSLDLERRLEQLEASTADLVHKEADDAHQPSKSSPRKLS